ncbi:putative efflux pump kojT [Hyphodiscus hymeniophilus]|uniref:Efflux pump kojT n=1 Tax=Hyphodiscus hymeniophilus TaxID=353542 RepID=A0A9P7B0B1_9HELO|nr:putative efflux pump kojT [Hyphodiscus hymeniophilus]
MWSYIQYREIGREVQEETSVRSEVDSKTHGARNGPSLDRRKGPLQGNLSESHLEAGMVSTNRERSEKEHGSRDDSSDHIMVCKVGENDPLDPLNWPLSSRCKNIPILTLLIFVQAWAGASGSMANSAASKEFHVSKVAENLSTAMYLFGIGSGALFVGPLSETVGRNPTYLTATFFYLLFVLGSALTPTFGGQVACRFFVGLFASATLAINGSSVRDQFRPVKRSFVFPIIAWANVAAPVIAPVAGGFIVSNTKLGWRWTEWVTLIISGFAFLIALLFLPETYLPILLDWKAEHLRRVTGDSRYVSKHAESGSFFQRTKKVIALPASFFGTEPIIAVLGGYLVLLYIRDVTSSHPSPFIKLSMPL